MRGAPESFASAVFFLVVAILLALPARHRCDLDEVAYLIDLSTQSGRDRLDHDVLVMLETERAQRGAMPPRPADPAADLLDAHLAAFRQLEGGRLLRTPRGVPDECTRHLRGLPRFRARLVLDRRRLDTALARDLLHRRELHQPVDRREHHVVGIRGTQALGQDVRDARALHDGAHRTAGDHAGAPRRRLHQHATRAMLADDFVRDRAACERHLGHPATRAVHGLADRLRHFVRLTGREAHTALAVADGNERVEREATATLHDLRDAVDRHHVLDQLTAFAVTAAAAIATAIATAATTTRTTTGSATAAATAAAAGTTAPTATATAAGTTASTAAASAPATRTASARTLDRSRSLGHRRFRRAAFRILFRHVIRTPGRPSGRRPRPL